MPFKLPGKPVPVPPNPKPALVPRGKPLAAPFVPVITEKPSRNTSQRLPAMYETMTPGRSKLEAACAKDENSWGIVHITSYSGGAGVPGKTKALVLVGTLHEIEYDHEPGEAMQPGSEETVDHLLSTLADTLE